MAPYKTGQLGNEAKNKKNAQVGFVGTNHQLGINAWRERLPLSREKNHQEEGAVPAAALQESCGISPQAAPASEGPLMQIRAVFHMYDPGISASRVNPRHELHNVMS